MINTIPLKASLTDDCERISDYSSPISPTPSRVIVLMIIFNKGAAVEGGHLHEITTSR